MTQGPGTGELVRRLRAGGGRPTLRDVEHAYLQARRVEGPSAASAEPPPVRPVSLPEHEVTLTATRPLASRSVPEVRLSAEERAALADLDLGDEDEEQA